jgi:hypothetical protein
MTKRISRRSTCNTDCCIALLAASGGFNQKVSCLPAAQSPAFVFHPCRTVGRLALVERPTTLPIVSLYQLSGHCLSRRSVTPGRNVEAGGGDIGARDAGSSLFSLSLSLSFGKLCA